ncbi:hypothetical protein HanHA300_Chr00c0194g0727401 [Helianthus annuus]|nr:hypothetical protein HanHA89_Chr05g0188521 [Helianthus annuus]KAJ0630548.1 hypothetical protein HanHA300_Chr00c0194g0727401 [Helianthus annuus]
MIAEDEDNLSQFWKDPSNMEILFDSVDRLSKSGATSDAPSFSLGLTQEFDMDEPTIPVCKRNEHVYNEADDHVPLTVIMSRIKENQELRSELKCHDNQIRLPYLNMPIDFNEKETKEEEQVWKYLWRANGELNEEMFKTCYRSIGRRGKFESLQPSCTVNHIVIDCWALVLNYSEARRPKGLPKRLFSSTSIVTGKSTSEQNLDALIKRNVHQMVNAIVIIDNLDMQERNQTDKHRKECMITASEVKEHLVRYMRSVRHINAELVEAQTPIRLNLQWYTTAIDSGVYVMRHMETYMGTRRNKWDCGFATQKSKLNKQLLMAKKKYAAKIILSDINLHRARIVDAINSQAI